MVDRLACKVACIGKTLPDWQLTAKLPKFDARHWMEALAFSSTWARYYRTGQ
jgi:hypothetical protein